MTTDVLVDLDKIVTCTTEGFTFCLSGVPSHCDVTVRNPRSGENWSVGCDIIYFCIDFRPGIPLRTIPEESVDVIPHLSVWEDETFKKKHFELSLNPFGDGLRDLIETVTIGGYEWKVTPCHEMRFALPKSKYSVENAIEVNQVRYLEQVAFCIENNQIEKPQYPNPEVPKWELNVSQAGYFSQIFPERWQSLPFTPIDPTISVDGERIVGDVEQRSPRWFEARKEEIKNSPVTSVVTSSGAYKMTGWFFKPGEGRVMSSRIMRLGRKLEEAVTVSFLCWDPNMRMHERGLVSHSTVAWMKDSPDGWLYNDTLSIENDVTDSKQSQWTGYGFDLNSIDFSKGILEVKVSEKNDDMADYYLVQTAWHMMVADRWWARIVKAKVKGACWSYSLLRDLDLENELISLVTQGKIAYDKGEESFSEFIQQQPVKAFRQRMRSRSYWFTENRGKCINETLGRKICAREVVPWPHPKALNMYRYMADVRRKVSVVSEGTLKWLSSKDESRETIWLPGPETSPSLRAKWQEMDPMMDLLVRLMRSHDAVVTALVKRDAHGLLRTIRTNQRLLAQIERDVANMSPIPRRSPKSKKRRRIVPKSILHTVDHEPTSAGFPHNLDSSHVPLNKKSKR